MTHNLLLHRKEAAERKGQSHTTGSTWQKIAFKVIWLDALNADGEAVPINTMLHDGSDSTMIREGFARLLRATGKKQTLGWSGRENLDLPQVGVDWYSVDNGVRVGGNHPMIHDALHHQTGFTVGMGDAKG